MISRIEESGADDQDPMKEETTLPELHRIALEALPPNMVQIMRECIEKGIPKEEMDRRIEAAGKTKIQEN